MFIIFVFADFDVTLSSPTHQSYVINDTVIFTGNGSATTNYNITSMDFYHDYGGWKINQTYKVATPLANTAVGNITIISGVPDGTTVKWNFRINYTTSNQITNESDATNLNWTLNVNMTTDLDIISVRALYFCNQSDTTVIGSGNYTVFGGTKKIQPTSNSLMNDGTAVCLNYTGFNLYYASANSTVYVEYPPSVVINLPANNSWQPTQNPIFNVTVTDGYTTDTGTYCQIYTNESGGWAVGQTYTMTNNTQKKFTYNFNADGAFKYNLKCIEQTNSNIYGWVTGNHTINLDSGVPNVNINFVNGTWSNTASNNINYTPSDINIDSCNLWLNNSGSTLYLNDSNTSLINGTPDIFTKSFADGNYTFYIGCNDTAGNWKNSSRYELRVDTVALSIPSVLNNSRANYCDQWSITVNTSKPANLSINYGRSSALGTKIETSLLSTTHTLNITNQSENGLYNFNVTSCDIAKNCNTTQPTYDYIFPFKLCTGWSIFGIYESQRNLSDILNQTNADFAYWWNDSAQGWKFATPGVSANIGLIMKYGDVIWLYDTNSTWARNVSGTGLYNKNFSFGHNYFAIPQYYTMGSFSATFLNVSDTFGSVLQTKLNTTLVNFSDYNVFNNSANTWTVPYYYNWSWNNNTAINKSSGLEVAWVWSEWNSSRATTVFMWNGSSLTWYNGSEWR